MKTNKKPSDDYFESKEDKNYREIERILSSDESVYRGFKTRPRFFPYVPNVNFDLRDPGRPRTTTPLLYDAPRLNPIDRYEAVRRRLETTPMAREAAYSPAQEAALRRSMFAEKTDALNRIQSEYAKDVSETQRLNLQAGLDTQARNRDAVARSTELDANLYNLWRQRADEIYANNLDLINKNYAQFLTVEFANAELENNLNLIREMMERDDFWQRLKARISLLQRPPSNLSLEKYK
jgi:hypothetical protein